MIGNAYMHMKKAMLALVRYSMEEGTFVDGEIRAYSAGIELVKDYFDMIFKEVFVDTSESYGLNMLEDLFVIKQPRTDLIARRNQIKTFLSLPRGVFDRGFFFGEIQKNSKDYSALSKNKTWELSGLNKQSADFHSQLCNMLSRYFPFMSNLSLAGSGCSFDKIDSGKRTWNHVDVAMMNFSMCDTF